VRRRPSGLAASRGQRPACCNTTTTHRTTDFTSWLSSSSSLPCPCMPVGPSRSAPAPCPRLVVPPSGRITPGLKRTLRGLAEGEKVAGLVSPNAGGCFCTTTALSLKRIFLLGSTPWTDGNGPGLTRHELGSRLDAASCRSEDEELGALALTEGARAPAKEDWPGQLQPRRSLDYTPTTTQHQHAGTSPTGRPQRTDDLPRRLDVGPPWLGDDDRHLTEPRLCVQVTGRTMRAQFYQSARSAPTTDSVSDSPPALPTDGVQLTVFLCPTLFVSCRCRVRPRPVTSESFFPRLARPALRLFRLGPRSVSTTVVFPSPPHGDCWRGWVLSHARPGPHIVRPLTVVTA
jgi:hypothetical protein